MELYDILLQVGLVGTAVFAYVIFFRRPSPITSRGHYREPGWNFPFKLLIARFAVRRWKSSRPKSELEEGPRKTLFTGWDGVTIRAFAPNGSTLLLTIRNFYTRGFAEVIIFVKLHDGTTYTLPQDTKVPWESIADGWSCNGLKILVLEPKTRLRILFNGLLTRVEDNVTQHARFNFIWASASSVVRQPEDWSDELAARALALDPWRDDRWPSTLDKWGSGSWLQWGTVQGRFQSYTGEGAVDRSEFLQTRGVRERSWSPHEYRALRRSVCVTAAARDGTAVQLQGFSYKDVLTIGFSGSARFPDCTVESITGTDLVLPQFCEIPEGVPSVYTINVSTKKRDLTMVLRVNPDGIKMMSGALEQHQVYIRTIAADINGEPGAGVLELGYEAPHAGKLEPPTSISLLPSLRMLSKFEAGQVGYCLPFEERAAACSDYVGGKGASLALLTSVQREQGYRVPPGFCLTSRALDKHLETNPTLREAIRRIQEANEDYDEKNFKEKCSKAAELFTTHEIVAEVKDEVLVHLEELRQKAAEQNFGPELRFAVRSSAVGEDSEALSAAGQNETVLGCVTDADVLRGVQRCWASMFAFTSAYYRRVNGQVCVCGGGVVVQALVSPRAAGVMFTRHPGAGDPSRLLITANYGLGESVVSGAVEPDTIIVKRGSTELTIAKTELGSKKQRVSVLGAGVATEDVSEGERRAPCLSAAEALRLARLGVAQEGMWGAGRDIEWAINDNDIFLLQARPITSLERWTEEELLHELDTPIMADDELITFANTGEVLPKPMTALSYDLILEPLTRGISDMMLGSNVDYYDKSLFFTHNRCALALYNSVYRSVPKEKDITISMMEMTIHGHRVATERILSTALHRRQHSKLNNFLMFLHLLKYISTTNRSMKETMEIVKEMDLNVETEDPLELLEVIAGTEQKMYQSSYNHCNTTTGSAGSQFITMGVLVEGEKDFTAEQCSEMNTLLSSGDVLSAEVPQTLADLARQLEGSGKMDEFRAQDPKKAMDWLKVHLSEVYEVICTFLHNHGHRAIMEFDLATKPWAMVPEKLIEVLQNIRPSKEDKQSSKSNADIIAYLKTPKKASTRIILSWLLPLCQRTVRHREGTKAHLILGVHKLRLAVCRLGRMLVRQWYLPDEDLIFHFRLNELRDYILFRDPVLLKKATQRRQYYPSWCKLKFNEINTGWVKPRKSRGPVVTAGDVKIEGASVCGGDVVARACVVKDLSEIDQLQRGDVLITHSTDIGWSPYFPLLAGIVTELGGLISHGAVIAREYGLPCIVGAVDATDMFSTGDMVRLSGARGVLERVQVADAPAADTES